MKVKNYLMIAVLVLFSSYGNAQKLAQSSQEKSKSTPFEVIKTSNLPNQNQLVTNFLKRSSILRVYELKKLLDESNINSDLNNSSNLRANKEFGHQSPNITKIFLDGEEILGEGFNRLHVLNQLRLEDIKEIKTYNVTYDNEIYIYKK